MSPTSETIIANALIDAGINEKISVQEARAFLALLAGEPVVKAQNPYGHWIKHRLADGAFIPAGCYVPSGPDYTVVPLYTHADDLAIDQFTALKEENRRLRNKVPARALTDSQLDDEASAIDEVMAGGFGEGGGSPGEWWYERADEIAHERKQRQLERELADHNRSKRS